MTIRKAPCLAVLGTGSDVGKSIVVTALCRFFSNLGIRVAPYKAQNMSNNSGVTPDGLEMGRAQVVQAEASRIAPHVDMNPVLLKPTSDVGAQVVVLGKAIASSSARDYHQYKENLFSTACQALDRLRTEYDLVILEGAGSCAEVNLMDNDIVNFNMAAYSDAPVVLVGDIHRGGIFAQLIGTLACIPKPCQDRIAGFIINRFRGDIDLFRDGVCWIEQHTQKPVFGVLPWFDHFQIEAEDSVVIENPGIAGRPDTGSPQIAVIRLPHISNFTDVDPLQAIPGLKVSFLEIPQDLSSFQAVILPGSKNTRSDLKWLFDVTWADRIKQYAQNGGAVLGICGGYQMLGRRVHDPDGVEAIPGSSAGLDLLPVETVLCSPKITTRTRFFWEDAPGSGYEIHMGQTQLLESDRFALTVTARNGFACTDTDGCISENSRIMGHYLHGFFDEPQITRKWLGRIGLPDLMASVIHGPSARDRAYDLLADHLKRYVDMDKLKKETRLCL
ncbi:MAG: cobyric acid synthase [Desulfatirhabdiaceae bacterium]